MNSVPAAPVAPLPEWGPLAVARDHNDRGPNEWLARSLGKASLLVELRRPSRYRDGTLELRHGSAVLAHHASLPLRTSSVGALALDMCLPSVPSLDPLFSEVRRVLRPSGTLAVMVPARPSWSPAELRSWQPLHRALGDRPKFRHESTRDHLHWLAAAADFAVLTDERRIFHLQLPDAVAAGRTAEGLIRDGVWPTDIPAERLDRVREVLIRHAGPGRTLPIPLRMLVARR